MAIKIVTPPTLELVTLAEAKAQCRVDITDEDTFITGLIGAARGYCEKIDWRAYLTQTIELWLDAWPMSTEISVPRPPLQSVTGIVYYDTGDVAHPLDTAVYQVDAISQPGRVALRYNQSWPSTVLRPTNAICVTYIAGWMAAANVPTTIKQAVLLLIGHWYENRETVIVGTISRAIEFGVEALLGIERAFRF